MLAKHKPQKQWVYAKLVYLIVAEEDKERRGGWDGNMPIEMDVKRQIRYECVCVFIYYIM
jgi:hypothetical protein